MMNGLKNSNFKIIIVGLLCVLLSNITFAQKGIVCGTVVNENGKPAQFVNIVNVIDGTVGTSTNSHGYYEISVKADTIVSLRATFIGYKDVDFTVKIHANEHKKIDFQIFPTSTDLQTVVVEDQEVRISTFDRIDAKTAMMVPSASNDIGAVIKTLPGVSSVNELSSQYSVRGGNFDENIVYVNGVEVFKPFLTRSGQQEGLSFVNSDLISSISFSAGGFEPKYGDKMSSTLDIIYKKPVDFHASATLSMLSSSIHIEDRIGKFTYLAGFRYKSNSYLLSTMDTKADYDPKFSDFQSVLTYTFNKKFDISVLGNYSGNTYKYVPESRETTFGSLMESYKMYMYMEGNENDVFKNGLLATTLNYYPNKSTNLNLTFSGYRSLESEYFDVLSEYWLGKLDNNLGSDDYGSVTESMGVGTFLSHARNKYKSYIYTTDFKGSAQIVAHRISWGAQYRYEVVHDKLNEWELIDSAGFTMPSIRDSIGYVDPSVQPDYTLTMYQYANANNDLYSHKASAFIQDSWSFENHAFDYNLLYGARLSYWNINNEIDLSPRLTFSLTPKLWKKNILFRFSTGYYFQQPSFREMRDVDGMLHTNIKSQKSIHFVAACDWNLMIWERPFKFITEAYYKYLDDIIPYTVDNVMIQYYPDMLSKGYAGGIDMKLTGELVKGVDSWVSVSLMKTVEKVKKSPVAYSDEYYPRPTDQRFMFSLFLQDYVPNYPFVKMQLNLTYGTGLPALSPNTRPCTSTYTRRYPPYFRVDLGLGWQIVSEFVKTKIKFLDRFNDISLTVEILNLLDTYNTISYTWVTDVSGYQYGVPDYLTLRTFNVKLSVKY